jgi:hypothetical protein
MGAVALDQLVLHGWDLAGATSQSFNLRPGQHGSRPCFHRRVRAAARDGLFGPVANDPRTRRRSTGRSDKPAETRVDA